jgi:hypothetical protein
VFNTQAEFQISIQSGGRKTAVVRWPTDQEWADRARRKKTVRRWLGRGKSSVETTDREAADRELWQKIVIQAPDGLDDAEIGALLARMEFTEVLSSERFGEEVTVELQVTDLIRNGEPAYVSKHTLRMPTQAQVKTYGLKAIHRVDGRREQISTIRLEAGGELYDALIVKVEGYTGATPLPHKDDVVMEILQVISIAEDDDPEI